MEDGLGDRLAVLALCGAALSIGGGCDQDRTAHASPSPTSVHHLPSEGFCSESEPPSSASAQTCACVAPVPGPSAAAPVASAPRAPTPGVVVPEESTQALVVVTPNWRDFRGKAQRYERELAGAWHPVGAAMPVALGRRGMAWGRGLHPEDLRGPQKREGDNNSPAGVFDLGEAYGYAVASPPGTSWHYNRLTVGWKCVDQPRRDDYNTLLLPEGAYASAPTGAWDGVRRDIVFDLFLMVKHNTSPVLPAAGSCVLIHPWINSVTPTQGCTSLPTASVQSVLSWLSPKQRPVLVQLPEEALQTFGRAWGLPGS